ncbi:MAG: DUF4129 domain-containing protein [Planctomycetia bacterium]|nr:DUF4129 domain-containing protein [Planctomycetia bacterium]
MKAQNIFWRLCFCCFCGFLFCLLNGSFSIAEETETQKIIENSLYQGRFPWYSPKDKSIIFLPPAEEAPAKETKNNSPKTNSPLLWLYWGAMTLIILVFSLLVFWAIFKIILENRLKVLPDKDAANEQRRLDALVPEVQDHIHDLLKEAMDAIDRNDFKKAIIFYFSYLLVKLDEYHYIRLHRGKTNFDYALEISAQTGLADIYCQVSDLFDKTYYGAFSISQSDFKQIWQLRDLFQELLLSEQIVSQPATLDNQPDKSAESNRQEPEIANAEIIVNAEIVHEQPPKSLINQVETKNEDSSILNNHDVQEKKSSELFKHLGIFLSIILLMSTGCQKNWKEEYEEVLPRIFYEQSINGDTLFRSVCHSRGMQTEFMKRVPETLNDYDSVVWYAEFSIFQAPLDSNSRLFASTTSSLTTPQNSSVSRSSNNKSSQQRETSYIEYYENWLKAKAGRTLILVDINSPCDRDFWNEMLQIAPSEHENWVKSKLPTISYFEKKQKSFEIFEKKEKKNNIVNSPSSNWFQLELLEKIHEPSGLNGDPSWTKFISSDYSSSFIYKILPGKDMEVVLSIEEIPFLCRKRVGESQILLFSSPQLFLNYYLLKRDHQLLLERLINQLKSPQKILLVRANGGFPQSENIQSSEPYYSIWKYSPFSILAWHMILLILLISFALFPIFGRPKTIPDSELNDFSKHINAYGSLIQKTNQSNWAIRQIERFRKNSR